MPGPKSQPQDLLPGKISDAGMPGILIARKIVANVRASARKRTDSGRSAARREFATMTDSSKNVARLQSVTKRKIDGTNASSSGKSIPRRRSLQFRRRRTSPR